MPGPGEYQFSNFCIGKEGRKWQFFKRNPNPHGKFIRNLTRSRAARNYAKIKRARTRQLRSDWH